MCHRPSSLIKLHTRSELTWFSATGTGGELGSSRCPCWQHKFCSTTLSPRTRSCSAGSCFFSQPRVQLLLCTFNPPTLFFAGKKEAPPFISPTCVAFKSCTKTQETINHHNCRFFIFCDTTLLSKRLSKVKMYLMTEADQYKSCTSIFIYTRHKNTCHRK